MGRLFLLLLIALGLAPGTWVRSPLPDLIVNDTQRLLIARLPLTVRRAGEVEVAGAWRLNSPNWHFRGFSALVAMGDGSLLAVTDNARQMRFVPPGSAQRLWVGFDYLVKLDRGDRRLIDAEGVTRDPATGDMWTSYEQFARIERYDRNVLPTGMVEPAEIKRWPSNRGAESIVRLKSGRFIVLSEGSRSWFPDALPAVLYRSDPVEGAQPTLFTFHPPDGFVPVDISELPDGRVVILLRRLLWRLPQTFEAKLVVADPDEIRPGQTWKGREIAHFAKPLPMDNYEGLAVEPGEGDTVVLWLISDDNFSVLQRTLLLKLLWQPNERARGSLRTPR